MPANNSAMDKTIKADRQEAVALLAEASEAAKIGQSPVAIKVAQRTIVLQNHVRALPRIDRTPGQHRRFDGATQTRQTRPQRQMRRLRENRPGGQKGR